MTNDLQMLKRISDDYEAKKAEAEIEGGFSRKVYNDAYAKAFVSTNSQDFADSYARKAQEQFDSHTNDKMPAYARKMYADALAEKSAKSENIDKAYTEWRAAPEQLEKSAREQAAEEARKIIERYGAEGMADEKDVEAYREAANRGIEKPEEFAYDMDAAIARFQNPNLQAAIDRGTAAIERSATARGMNDGTDLRKAIADYATSKASEDYQKAAQLAAADKQAQLEAWRSKAQLGQQADTTGLSALQILAGYGNANVGEQTGLELGSMRYGFDTTETGYQNRYAQMLAQEKDEADRKAAEDAANKKLAADFIGGLVKIFRPKS